MPGLSLFPKTHSFSNIFWKFLPFWIFLTFFKFGGSLQYAILAPFGERLMPLWLVGILIGFCSVAQLVLDIPVGYVLDKYGYLKFLRLSTFVFLFAAIFLIFGLNIVNYFFILGFGILGGLFFAPGVNAYILSHAPKDNDGKFISLRDVFGSVGVVLASASLPFILIGTPEHAGRVILTLLLFALVLLFLSPKDNRSIIVENADPRKIPDYYVRRHAISEAVKAIKKLNPASGMLALLSLVAAMFYGIIWFVVPLVIVHQIGSEFLGLGLGIFDFSVVILGFWLGTLADRFNKRTLVFFGLLIFAVAGMFLGFNFGLLFIIFGFLATTGDEMAGISLWSWLHALDHEHAHDGVVSSVICLFEDLGWAIGPMVAGFAYGIIGPSWTIVLGAFPIFIVWIIYQFMAPRHSPYALSGSDMPIKPYRPRHKT